MYPRMSKIFCQGGINNPPDPAIVWAGKAAIVVCQHVGKLVGGKAGVHDGRCC